MKARSEVQQENNSKLSIVACVDSKELTAEENAVASLQGGKRDTTTFG
jgi:hypothetical protein